MARHFEVKIKVAYDEAHGPLDDMAIELKRNVHSCVECSSLLNDVAQEVVVEEWSVEVEETTRR